MVPESVSAVAEKIEFPKDLLVWNFMGLLKWGKVEVAGEENHELIYRLKEV